MSANPTREIRDRPRPQPTDPVLRRPRPCRACPQPRRGQQRRTRPPDLGVHRPTRILGEHLEPLQALRL